MSEPDTEILLATYNGARHLPELLASLEAQTDQDWRLVVRDDGSEDATLEILSNWGRAHPDRFELRGNDSGDRGAAANFAALLAGSGARYFLPCDQDDIWLPDKIARLRAAIVAVEASSPPDTPIIAHSDLRVVDASLDPVADSMWALANLRMPPEDLPWGLMTLQNVVTGCAMIGNAALLRAALPIPPDCKMHDWWLALVASYFGCVVHLEEPGVLYRQHGSNTLGANNWSMLQDLCKALAVLRGDRSDVRHEFAITRRQAAAFLARMGPRLSAEQAAFLTDFGQLEKLSPLERRRFYRRYQVRLRGIIRGVGLWFLP